MDANNESQQQILKDSSIGDLIQQSAAVLENECLVLEKECEEKLAYLNQLKDNCKKQAENNEKQSKELERLKMLTQFEVMNRDNFLSLNSKQKGKCQEMEKYFNDLCKMINLGISSKEELTMFHDALSDMAVSEEAELSNLRQKSSAILSHVDDMLANIEDQKEKEKKEFEEVKTSLKILLSQQEQQSSELKNQKQMLESECKEIAIMLNMVTPQLEEIKLECTNSENELLLRRKTVNFEHDQLQSSLEEKLKKKEYLTEELKQQEHIIEELNSDIAAKEGEREAINCLFKGLIAEEEELRKTYDFELDELNKLQSKVELLGDKYNQLLETNEENIILNKTVEELANLSKKYNQSIRDFEQSEKLGLEELDQLKKEIEAMQIEKRNIEKEKNEIKIKETLSEIEDEANKHREMSIDIENDHQHFLREQVSLSANIEAISTLLLEVNNVTQSFQKNFDQLYQQLSSAETEFKQIDLKITSFQEICNLRTKSMLEQEQILDENITMSENELKKAQSDIKQVDIYKAEIKQLAMDLEDQQQHFEEELKLLQDTNNQKIEEKKRMYEELRIKYEGEFKKKEQLKTDAMMEVRENKMKINELQQQRSLAENDVERLKKNLVKYDNLVSKLDKKLYAVAQVAIAPSQSMTDMPSQSTDFPSTSQASKKTPNTFIFPSSHSCSSVETYVPTKEYKQHVKKTFPTVADKSVKKPTSVKKPVNQNTAPMPTKSEDEDSVGWGF